MYTHSTPRPIQQLTLSFLSPRDQAKVMPTSKDWNQLCHEPISVKNEIAELDAIQITQSSPPTIVVGDKEYPFFDRFKQYSLDSAEEKKARALTLLALQDYQKAKKILTASSLKSVLLNSRYAQLYLVALSKVPKLAVLIMEDEVLKAKLPFRQLIKEQSTFSRYLGAFLGFLFGPIYYILLTLPYLIANKNNVSFHYNMRNWVVWLGAILTLAVTIFITIQFPLILPIAPWINGCLYAFILSSPIICGMEGFRVGVSVGAKNGFVALLKALFSFELFKHRGMSKAPTAADNRAEYQSLHPHWQLTLKPTLVPQTKTSSLPEKKNALTLHQPRF